MGVAQQLDTLDATRQLVKRVQGSLHRVEVVSYCYFCFAIEFSEDVLGGLEGEIVGVLGDAVDEARRRERDVDADRRRSERFRVRVRLERLLPHARLVFVLGRRRRRLLRRLRHRLLLRRRRRFLLGRRLHRWLLRRIAGAFVGRRRRTADPKTKAKKTKNNFTINLKKETNKKTRQRAVRARATTNCLGPRTK